jgi:tRNA-binding protein
LSEGAGIISYREFEKVEMRIGKIIDASPFPEAHKPAFRLRIDFGPQVGIKNSSAQLTARYTAQDLVGRKVVAVVNFAPKQIANFRSEVLVLGVSDGSPGGIILLEPESDEAPLGSRVF